MPRDVLVRLALWARASLAGHERKVAILLGSGRAMACGRRHSSTGRLSPSSCASSRPLVVVGRCVDIAWRLIAFSSMEFVLEWVFVQSVVKLPDLMAFMRTMERVMGTVVVLANPTAVTFPTTRSSATPVPVHGWILTMLAQWL